MVFIFSIVFLIIKAQCIVKNINKLFCCIEKEKIQVKIQGYRQAAIVFHGISMYTDSMW